MTRVTALREPHQPERGERAGVRRARATDEAAAAALMYSSAGGMYDRFMGGREQALRVLRRAFATTGTNASAEVVTVAELDGRVAAVSAAFPVEETVPRAEAFLRLTLRALPPWRWPSALWLYYSGARAAPHPPVHALYVDALATDPALRRRGAARALLRAAERRATELRLPAVALDTSLDNHAARSLYLSEGFEEVAYRPARRGLPGFVALVKRLG
jgi:ribosomal protein S18 acetylase RimI-like enzyme